MKILQFKVGEEPEYSEIENSLSEMQKLVGGWIEIVCLDINGIVVLLVCNELGKLNGMSFNRRVQSHDIYGNFFLCCEDDEGRMCDFDERVTLEMSGYEEINYV